MRYVIKIPCKVLKLQMAMHRLVIPPVAIPIAPVEVTACSDSSSDSDEEGPISNNITGMWPKGRPGDDSSSDEEGPVSGGLAMPPKKQFSEGIKVKKLKTPKFLKVCLIFFVFEFYFFFRFLIAFYLCFEVPRVRPSSGMPKVKRSADIPRDENGNVMLPFKLGGITYHSLGKINPAPGFHSDKYIWPVGFTSSRIFFSIKNPDNKIRYMSRIVDGGDGPKVSLLEEIYIL